eukprot:3995877-Pyramimonas_sp.AAC.1
MPGQRSPEARAVPVLGCHAAGHSLRTHWPSVCSRCRAQGCSHLPRRRAGSGPTCRFPASSS